MSIQLKALFLNLALSFGLLAIKDDWQTATYAGLSALVLGFFLHLEKEKSLNIDVFKADIKALKDRVDGLSLSQGFKR